MEGRSTISSTNLKSARFDSLYGRYYQDILAYCLRRESAEDAAAAANETFAIAWRRLDDMPPRQLPWLYGVARKVLAGQRRTRHRYNNLIELFRGQRLASIEGPETIVVRRADYELVLQALSTLRPGDKEILSLTAWEGLSHREIGETLGVSVAAVDQRFHRAKRRLAERLESLERSTGRLEGGHGSP